MAKATRLMTSWESTCISAAPQDQVAACIDDELDDAARIAHDLGARHRGDLGNLLHRDPGLDPLMRGLLLAQANASQRRGGEYGEGNGNTVVRAA